MCVCGGDGKQRQASSVMHIKSRLIVLEIKGITKGQDRDSDSMEFYLYFEKYEIKAKSLNI